MANFPLDFEKPILELESKIAELRSFAEEKGLDLGDQITLLEARVRQLEKDIFGNLNPWQKTLIARHGDRPGTQDYIKFLIEDFIELRGDRGFGDDQAIIGGIGFFQGRPVTVIGHRKGRDTKENLACNFGMAHPEGYRKALRLMEQGAKFGRPIIAFIDTKGAYCGIGAEERGQGEAIARNLKAMALLPVPIIAVVIGEGGSGGALALGLGDRILMLENAVYSVASPESSAAILWKDAARAPEAAAMMSITAQDLHKLGIVDEVVEEPQGGAHRDPGAMAQTLGKVLAILLEELVPLPASALLQQRYDKYRRIGA